MIYGQHTTAWSCCGGARTSLLRVVPRWLRSRSCLKPRVIFIIIICILLEWSSGGCVGVRKAATKVEKLCLGSDLVTGGGALDLAKFVLVYIGEVVKVSIFTVKACQIWRLHGCFFGGLDEELLVNKLHVRWILNLWNEGRIDLFQVQLFPVNWAEKWMRLELCKTSLAASYSFIRLLSSEKKKRNEHIRNKCLLANLHSFWGLVAESREPRRRASWGWGFPC